MNNIGETLRRERLRQGLDLTEVSQATKIGTRMLLAMEAGEYGKLPGGVFTRSFLKQYASALGIDPGFVESELKNLYLDSEESPRPASKRVEPEIPGFASPGFSERPVEPRSLLVSATWVILALIACGAVYLMLNRETVPTAPPASNQQSQKKPAQPAPQPVEAAASAPEAKPAASTPNPPAPATSSGEAMGTGPLQVVLTASEDSWVSVSADGKNVFSGILKPTEKKQISAAGHVKLVVGNAGGLEIVLNGKSIDAIGPKGQVRIVELTKAGAQVVSRAPNAAPLL